MIIIGNGKITLDDFYRIIYNKEKIVLDKKVLNSLDKNFQFLQEFSKDKVIYGVNTGFGPMAPYIIKDVEQEELQYNLIRSHASGGGNLISHECVKALMLSRLQSLMLGYSGVTKEVVILLKNLINKDIYPHIPEHGGVGASGDLVQLAHLAVVMIGEGEVSYNGKVFSTKRIFNKLKLKPISIRKREGLALINGTSSMCGIGVINVLLAKRLLSEMILASSILQEIFESYDDSFSKELNSVKLHNGQNEIAKRMREILSKNKLIKKRHEYLYNWKIQEEVLKERVQEYYSLRCVPQILGPILETIENSERIVMEEVNSVNDNPVIDSKNKNVFHGGNFHGDYISHEMDKLKIAITKLSMLSERQLAFILNDNLNKTLPPFVNLGKLGLNLGMQGVQFTATSTVAENQTLSFPMNIHSISTNKDNQDIVSMGTNAAIMANKIIHNSFEVLAIEYMAILQAVDYLKINSKLSPITFEVYKKLRNIVPVFKKDAVRFKEIRELKNYLTSI
ncbi:MAG TPA: aromatic amino acid ammonia-lyase [Candidatus Nanoarchaeia archaeon]|nr:aromatic amino acid ammonia-lyase [Candidatus Nanoarchaeia archaeon]